jgi:hypothetical protein
MFLNRSSRENIRAGISKAQGGKTLFFTHSEVIDNFELQEKTTEPHYCFYDYKHGEPITPPGFLIWSLWDGCGVAYRRSDGEIILARGVQSDFCYM